MDLVIVGAQKSFTTSLKHYLGGHPAIFTHPQQEMAYFHDDKEYHLGLKRTIAHYYRGIEKAQGKKILAKSAILYTSEEGIKRLYEYNPNCKLIYSLRNPVDRAYSAYLMESNYAKMDFPFNKINLVAEKADTDYWPYNVFIDAGNYAKHLKIIYKYFPKEQVKIVLSKEIRENAISVCKQIFQWIGVDDTYTPEIKIHNPTLKRRSRFSAAFSYTLLKQSPAIKKYAGLILPSSYNYKVGNLIRMVNSTKHRYEQMDTATREYLIAYYREANKELEEMTGLRVTALWNK